MHLREGFQEPPPPGSCVGEGGGGWFDLPNNVFIISTDPSLGLDKSAMPPISFRPTPLFPRVAVGPPPPPLRRLEPRDRPRPSLPRHPRPRHSHRSLPPSTERGYGPALGTGPHGSAEEPKNSIGWNFRSHLSNITLCHLDVSVGSCVLNLIF